MHKTIHDARMWDGTRRPLPPTSHAGNDIVYRQVAHQQPMPRTPKTPPGHRPTSGTAASAKRGKNKIMPAAAWPMANKMTKVRHDAEHGELRKQTYRPVRAAIIKQRPSRWSREACARLSRTRTSTSCARDRWSGLQRSSPHIELVTMWKTVM